MHHWEAAGVCLVVKSMPWQRKEGEKLFIKVMNLMGPLLWMTFYLRG